MSATSQTITIAASASLSAAVNLGGSSLSSLSFPAAWDAALLSFSVSYDGVTYFDLYDEYGTEKTITVTAGKAIFLSPFEQCTFNYVKLRSGTTGTPVNQTALRTFNMGLRAFQ